MFKYNGGTDIIIYEIKTEAVTSRNSHIENKNKRNVCRLRVSYMIVELPLKFVSFFKLNIYLHSIRIQIS